MDVAIVGVGLHPFGRFAGVIGDRDGRDRRSAARSPTPASSGATSSSRSPAATRSTTRTRWSRCWGSRASRSPTSTTAARPRRACSRWPPTRSGSASTTSASPSAWTSTCPGAFSADPRLYACPSWYGELGHFLTTKFFGMKINKYMHDHGISAATLARVAAKNYRNGALNPNAFRRKPLSEEEILGSRMLNHPLTQYMFCSPDEGAAAVVLCRADRAHRYTDKPIYLRASAVRTRRLGAFEVHSPWLPIEETAGPTVDASRAAFETAGIGPEDVDVIQLQDTDAGAEVIHLAENGFCADGEQEKLVADGELEIGGRLPVNTDGGLIANGEPIGASGLRQVHEVVLQLRGQAGDRQVPGDAEGRLHAALRRTRRRGRVDPLRLTEPTPIPAEQTSHARRDDPGRRHGEHRSAARRRGRRRARPAGDVPRARRAREHLDAGHDRRRRRAGRSRRDLGAERPRLDRRRARRAIRRRGAGADQHALEGRRGGVRPVRFEGGGARHDGRLPRHRHRRHAARRRDAAPPPAPDRAPGRLGRAPRKARRAPTWSTGTRSRRAPRRSPPPRRRQRRRACDRRTRATSCSRPARRGGPRA